ncbi:ATP-grasp domain-containing protein [Actinocatenispora comari]|uniref:ATP-grasp domain-containing protein n=1 Tax=Actinocatenispora comari TaxID=2807577 RepID=UPI001A914961|nr:ATP-grasp domain-containing protein [Actinocatenispora comari]
MLVTGVGGAPGFDLARSLARLGCHVIAVDADPLAAGLHLPGVSARVAARAHDSGYPQSMLAICDSLRPDVLMSTVEQELNALIAMRAPLADRGVQTWLPSPAAVEACIDKAVFARVLAHAGVPSPATFLPEHLDKVPPGPLVVKPRFGQGGKDVYRCTTRRQAQMLCELVDRPIVQPRLVGWEFTADCLVDHDHRASVILRRRLLVKGGLSMVSETFDDREVEARVIEALAATGIVGACCVQGFCCPSDTSQPRVVITEANARVAGGFPLAEAAGADLVGQTLNAHLGRPVDHGRLTYQPGVRLTKYVETLTCRTSEPAHLDMRNIRTARPGGGVQ